jgi:hypothetical protein
MTHLLEQAKQDVCVDGALVGLIKDDHAAGEGGGQGRSEGIKGSLCCVWKDAQILQVHTVAETSTGGSAGSGDTSIMCKLLQEQDHVRNADAAEHPGMHIVGVDVTNGLPAGLTYLY